MTSAKDKLKIFFAKIKNLTENLIENGSSYFYKIVSLSRSFFTARFDLIDNEALLEENSSLSDINPKLNKPNTLFFMIIAVVVIFGIWGSIAKIDRSVLADGSVMPKSKIQSVQSIIRGKLEEIHVKEGDFVKKGQAMFSIDAIEVIAERDKSENLYYLTLAKIGRLKAEAGITEKLSIDEEVRKNKPDFAILEEKIFHTNMQELKIAERQLQMSQELFDQGAESEMVHLSKKRDLLMMKNTILNELAQAEEILANVKAVLPGQRLRANQAVVKSPLDGTVTNLNVSTLGQVVDPGSQLAEVVPEEESLVVEVRILPQDAAFVQKGMNAYIALTSYDQSVYGRMDGNVDKISANTRTDEQGNSFYIATLSANIREFADKVNGPIQSGMVAQASIVADKRTVLGYVFSPVTKLQSKAFREK